MHELETQKETILKQISDAQSEKEMGLVLDDSSMVAESERKIEEFNELLRQIDLKIEELAKQEQEEHISKERRRAIRQEIAEKYPEQYDYYRISSMSEAEVRTMNSERIQEVEAKKDSLRSTLEGYSKRTDELLGQLSTTEHQIEEIKQKFLETHDMSLMMEAKNLAESKKNITEELEELRQKIEEASKEFESIEDVVIDVEKYKKEAIEKLSGKYTTEIGGPTLDLIRQKQAEGKSIKEITEEINATAKESKQEQDKNAYFQTDEFIQYKNLEASMNYFHPYGRLDSREKEKIPLIIERATGMLNSPIADEKTRSFCQELLDLLNIIIKTQEKMEQLEAETEGAKIPEGDFTYPPEIQAKSDERDRLGKLLEINYLPKLRSLTIIGKTICQGRVVSGYEQATGIKTDYNQNDESEIITSEREREAKALQQENVRIDYYSAKNDDGSYVPRTPAQERLIVEFEERKEEIERLEKRIYSKFDTLSTAYSNIILGDWYNSMDKKTSDIHIIEIPGSSNVPGEYTVEDVERYLIEQKYLAKEKECAELDSKDFEQELTKPKEETTKNEEIEEMLTEEPVLKTQEDAAVLTY